MGFPGGASGKEPACQCRRQEMQVQSLGWEKSPGEENGNALQYSCLENPMDRAAWAVHKVAKSQTGLKQLNTQHIWKDDQLYSKRRNTGNVCVCVWRVMVVKWVKGVNRHKLPVTKYISLGGMIHSMITMVNNTVLHIWKLWRIYLKSLQKM